MLRTCCGAGYVIAVSNIPKPFWRYPMHYLGYHTYSIHGMMTNEFMDTYGWGCPCEITPQGCGGACEITGTDVLKVMLIANVVILGTFGTLTAETIACYQQC